jgi:hypothetical protein
VYDDRIVHNWTFNAITPFSGVGSNTLTFAGNAPPNVDIGTWNHFQYGVQHENAGGVFEAQAAAFSPFYVRINANRKDSNGLKPLGAAGTSPGGPAYELAAPIDWTTTDVGGEIGYTTKAMHLSFLYSYSRFESNQEYLFWRTPAVQSGPNMETSTIAPDNKMQRYVLNGVFRQLPYDSTLALRGTYAKYENNFAIGTTFLSVTGSQPAGVGNTRLANPSVPNFSGDVVNTTFSGAYNSNWSREWSSKLYYNYYKRENDSSAVVFTPSGPGSGGTCDVNLFTGASLTTCSTDPLKFTKNNAGAEAYWRVSRGNRITLGLDYTNVERERVDVDRNKDLKVFGEWKTSNFEFGDIRVKYTHLDRDANFLLATAASPFDRDLLRFDVAPLKRDVLKIVLDMYPAPMTDVGVELNFKRNRYKDTTLGRTDDRREEIYLSAGYGDMKTARVTGFFDWEYTYYDSNHWVGDVATYPHPNPSAGAYFWNSRVHDHNWLLGGAAEWVANDMLRFYASAIWQKGDGGVDFTAPSVANAQNIQPYDDFQKRSLNFKAIVKASKDVDVTLGYAYEKYSYSDIQLNDYIYNIKTGSNQNFFSGAYANPSYRTNILYGMVTWRF